MSLSLSVATHNLADGDAKPTFDADICIFTEAVLADVKEAAADAGYDVHYKRSLLVRKADTIVVATRKGLLDVRRRRFHFAHGGRAKVSPARGTLMLKCRLSIDGSRLAILAHHRISGWWKDADDKSDVGWRKRMWQRHYELDRLLVARMLKRRYRVIGGGDPNAWPTREGRPRHPAWDDRQGVEVGNRLDRIFASHPAKVVKQDYRSAAGSDHPRLLATFVWHGA